MFFKSGKSKNSEILKYIGAYVLEKKLDDFRQEVIQEIEKLMSLCFYEEGGNKIIIDDLKVVYEIEGEKKEALISYIDSVKIYKYASEEDIVRTITEINLLSEDFRLFRHQNEIDIKHKTEIFKQKYRKAQVKNKWKHIGYWLYLIVTFTLAICLFPYLGFVLAANSLGFHILTENLSISSIISIIILEAIGFLLFIMVCGSISSFAEFLLAKLEPSVFKGYLRLALTIFMVFPLLILCLHWGPLFILTIKPSLAQFSMLLAKQDPMNMFLSIIGALATISGPLWKLLSIWWKLMDKFYKSGQQKLSQQN